MRGHTWERSTHAFEITTSTRAPRCPHNLHWASYIFVLNPLLSWRKYKNIAMKSNTYATASAGASSKKGSMGNRHTVVVTLAVQAGPLRAGKNDTFYSFEAQSLAPWTPSPENSQERAGLTVCYRECIPKACFTLYCKTLPKTRRFQSLVETAVKGSK